MATLGKTSITELTLVTPLSNDNLANPHITIDGVKVPLGGNINLLATNDAMIFKGTITSASLPITSQAGWTYKVATAGTYYNVKMEVGDLVIAVKDNSGTTISASNFSTYWTVVQTNTDGHVTGPTTSGNGNFASFDGTTGKLIKDSGYNFTSFTNSFADKNHDHDSTYLKKTSTDIINALGYTPLSPDDLEEKELAIAGTLNDFRDEIDGKAPIIHNHDSVYLKNIDPYLTSTQNSTLQSVASTTTTNRQYAVEYDSNGKLSVNVPWVNNSGYDVYATTVDEDSLFGVSLIKKSIKTNAQTTALSLLFDKQYFNGVISSASTLYLALEAQGIINALGYTPVSPNDLGENELVITNAINSLKDKIDTNEEITSSAINFLKDKVDTNEEITSSALNLLNSNVDSKLSIEDFEDVELVISTSLNDFNNRLENHNHDDKYAPLSNSYISNLVVDGTCSKIGVTRDTTNSVYLVGVPSGATTPSTTPKIGNVSMKNNILYATGGVNTNSDERLKNFGGDIVVDLDKLAELPKKYFTWKGDEEDGFNIGTSAQELQKIYPELVTESPDGYLAVNYAQLSIIALKAIDILNEERKQLKSDIEAIKNKLGL